MKLSLSTPMARGLIAFGAGYTAWNNVKPAEGQAFAFPSFSAGFMPVYLPAGIAVASLIPLPFISRGQQKGLIVVFTVILVGRAAIEVIQARQFTFDTVIGTLTPLAGAISLAIPA